MKDVILVIDILAALGIVGLVLLQQGKGADMGAAFGSGASQTLFGARGSANFLTRATAVLATVFFVANLTLAWLASKETVSPSVTTVIEEPAPSDVPSIPVEPSKQEPTVPEVPK
jgi:preprotein translocase subunit SecG